VRRREVLCFIESRGVSRGRCCAVDGTWSWATWQPPPSVRMLASYGGICSGTLASRSGRARRAPARVALPASASRVRGAVPFWGPGGGAQPAKSCLAPFAPPQKKKISRSPKLWLGPRNLAVLLTHRGQLILGKISIFDATRCQILRQKRTKLDFRWNTICSKLHWVSLQSYPRLPSCS